MSLAESGSRGDTHHKNGEELKGKLTDGVSDKSQARGRNGVKDEPTPPPNPPAHLPVCFCLSKNFPLLTANEYFRTAYDYVARIYIDFRNSFLVTYLIGWFLVFFPLMKPSLVVLRAWLWIVSTLFWRPTSFFWWKIFSIIGFSTVVFELWTRTIHLLDLGADYLVNSVYKIYQYIKDAWKQVTIPENKPVVKTDGSPGLESVEIESESVGH